MVLWRGGILWCASFGDQSELLLEGQIVLEVPVLSDTSVGDPVNVGGDEIDRLAAASGLSKLPCEMTAEAEVCDNAVTGHDHLLNLAAKVGDRRAHELRGRQRSRKSLRAPGRQRAIDKVRRKGSARQCFISGIPASIEAPRSNDLRGDLCFQQTAIDDQAMRLNQCGIECEGVCNHEDACWCEHP